MCPSSSLKYSLEQCHISSLRRSSHLHSNGVFLQPHPHSSPISKRTNEPSSSLQSKRVEVVAMSSLHLVCKGTGIRSGKRTVSDRVCNHPKPRELNPMDSKRSCHSEMVVILHRSSKHR